MEPASKRRRHACKGCGRDISTRQYLRHRESMVNDQCIYKCSHEEITDESIETADLENEHQGHSTPISDSDDSTKDLDEPSQDSDISIEVVEKRVRHRHVNIEDTDRNAFFDEIGEEISGESSGEEIDSVSEDDDQHMCDSDDDSQEGSQGSSEMKIARWIALFLLSWQSLCYISDRALTHIISFLKVLLGYLGTFTPLAATISQSIPTNIYGIRKLLNVEVDCFDKYVVCVKCFSLYKHKDCTFTFEGRVESKECWHVPFPSHKQKHMRGKCGQPLLKEVRTINGGVKLIPFKTYCYYPIERSLKSMVAREGFLEKCKEWQTRTCEENVYRDVYDGEVWKTFASNTGFLNQPNSLGLMLNLDWFQPFKHVSYSVGAIYAVILNLPRSERFRKENTLLIGLIPHMGHEPPTNTFLKPLVHELKEAWSRGFKLPNGDNLKAALLCVGCDIPASRKLCGFLGHAATKGCNHCGKSFPGSVGEKLYGGFDRESWPTRSKQEHMQQCEEIERATTKTEKELLERAYGVRYSVLLELPYFDPFSMTVIDPMHNLFLGTAKHMVNVWKSTGLLDHTQMSTIQEKVDDISCPADIGKTPQKIASSFGGFNADQFKNWTILFSMYALQGVLPELHLKCWQKFVLACKFLCTQTITENNILLADRLLLGFCKSFEQLYGEDKVTPNMHLHCHLVKFLRNYGPIYSFWLFSFERDNGILGNFPVNMRNIEPQLMRRFIRDSTWTGDLSRTLKWIDENDDLSDFASAITSMEHRVRSRGTLSKCEVGDIYKMVKKSSRTSNIFETDWEMPHTSRQVISSKRSKKSLTATETDHLRKMYKELYRLTEEDLNNCLIPSSGYSSRTIYMYGTVLGSTLSRSRRSAFIMAHWGEEDSMAISNGSVKPRPGEIECFLFHNFIIAGKVKQHIFAKVKWFKKAPGVVTDLYRQPVQVWQNLYEEEGPSSFLPVQRIKSKFVSHKTVLKHKNVVIVIPREKYLV